MLITGVGKTVSRDVLAGQLNLTTEQLITFHCCVDIEKAAMDTRGNAIASYWADANQFRQSGWSQLITIYPAHILSLNVFCQTAKSRAGQLFPLIFS